MSFESKLKAACIINEFMGTLAYRYNAAELKEMWKSMDAMRCRYGDEFVAAAVNKSRPEAELALLRYGKTQGLRQPDPEDAEDQMSSGRWHKAFPKERSPRRIMAALIGLLALAMAASAIIEGGKAIDRSDRLIEQTDALLAGKDAKR